MNIKTFLVLGIFLASFSAHGMEEINHKQELFNIADRDMQRAQQQNNDALNTRIQAVLDNGVDINSKDAQGNTPLHIAAKKGNELVVETLLDNGANPNSINDLGNTPLIESITSVPFRRNRRERLVDVDYFQSTVQTIAVVEKLLNNDETNVDLQNNEKSNALIEASKRGLKDIVEKLLEKVTYIDLQNNEGNTALLEALQADYDEIADLLVNAGADTNVKNNIGVRPALWYPEDGEEGNFLKFEGHEENDIATMVQELMSEGLPPDNIPQIPDDLNDWDRDRQLEFWVNQQMLPPNRTRLKRIFKLIGRAPHNPFMIRDGDHVVPPTSLRELDVLVGSGVSEQHRSHCIAKRINKTKLHIGYATLVRHLAQIKSVENLTDLQEEILKLNTVTNIPQRIRHIVNQDEATLRVTIQSFLNRISPLEDMFLSFWIDQEQYDIIGELLKQKEVRKFGGYNESLNSSPFFVSFLQLNDFLLPAIAPVIAVGVAAGSIATKNPWLIVPACITAAWSVAEIPETYKNYKDQIMALYLMQKKLISLATFVNQLDELRTELHRLGVNRALTDELKLPTQTNLHLRKLKTLLNTTTFQGLPSFFSHWGKICVAYRLMLKHRDEFIRAYLALGTIDFICSLNALLADSTTRAPYCLAEFQTEDRDIAIEIEKCWSPLLDPDTVVTNDIILGKDEHQRTVLITGPNARGKTSLMRAVGDCALLASTLGIGSAKKIVVPPDLDILTSINIGDDPHRQLSLFKATTRRMKKLKATLSSQPKRPTLVVGDEPFVGTDRFVAQACASNLIESIAKRPNAMALFSSHLPITDLEKKHPDLIKNIHLANGFRVVPGADPDREEYDDVAISIIADEFEGDDDFVSKIREDLHETRKRDDRLGDISKLTSKLSDDELLALIDQLKQLDIETDEEG